MEAALFLCMQIAAVTGDVKMQKFSQIFPPETKESMFGRFQ